MNLPSPVLSVPACTDLLPEGVAIGNPPAPDMVIGLPDRAIKQLAHIKHSDSEAGVGVDKTVHLKNEIPTLFGRYRLLKILGKGGMGSVYLAEDTQLGRTVAYIKIPHLASDSAQITARFHREAQAAATVTHPNICPLYDVGEANGVPYLIMAYIEGTPLSTVMAAGPALDVREVVSLMRKLALAMHEAHQRGVIHRDLKPANVLIDRRGEPIITDFGIAWLRRMNGGLLTLPGTAWGTPAYMAPEVLNGTAEAGCPGCDIYALGVIFYELLTGRIPFSGEPSAVLYQIELGTPRPPSKLRPDISPKLEAICLKAMAKDVAVRYASMAELAVDLSNVSNQPFNFDGDIIAEDGPEQDWDKTDKVIQPSRPAKLNPAATPAHRRSRRPRMLWVGGLAILGVAALLGAMFNFDSSPGYGMIQVKLSDSEGERQVSIDGNRLSAEDSGKSQRLETGMHWLSVTGKDCEPANVSFRVEKGQNSIVYVELQPKSLKPAIQTPEPVKEKPALIAPRLLGPPDQTVFNVFPRQTRLTWDPVSGAVQYRVQIQFSLPFPGAEWYNHPDRFRTLDFHETTDTMYRFDFVGAQPGRWRVWAVDESGREGPKSAWWYFEYTK